MGAEKVLEKLGEIRPTQPEMKLNLTDLETLCGILYQ